MLAAILGDSHFGVRGDSIVFHKKFEKFYLETFFPYLIKHNIKTIYQMGDLFDRRKYINFDTLYRCRHYFFDKLVEHDIKMITLLGNHDIFFKDTLKVNSPQLLLQDYIDKGVIQVIDKPTAIDGIDILPWICTENEQDVLKFIKRSSNLICLNHCEITGFEMDRGNVCNEGINRKTFDHYDMVLCGHFHHKSSDGHVTYVGAPCEYTWADCDDPKGFHILDTGKKTLEFIVNPFVVHQKIIFEDGKLFNSDMKELVIKDVNVEDCYVKLIVLKKDESGRKLDIIIKKLQAQNPAELNVIEDDIGTVEETEESDNVDQSDDTLTIIRKYVDSLNMDRDSDKIKNVITEIYNDAIKVEQA